VGALVGAPVDDGENQVGAGVGSEGVVGCGVGIGVGNGVTGTGGLGVGAGGAGVGATDLETGVVVGAGVAGGGVVGALSATINFPAQFLTALSKTAHTCVLRHFVLNW